MGQCNMPRHQRWVAYGRSMVAVRKVEDNGRKIDVGRKERGWKEVDVVEDSRCMDDRMSSSRYSYRATRLLAGCDE
jgi:hypothetical protein